MCVCVCAQLVKSICPPSKFLFLVFMLFLTKQVKHLNGFIYNTKYESYWAKLNTNQTKNTKTLPASQILSILSTKDRRSTEDCSAQFSGKSY